MRLVPQYPMTEICGWSLSDLTHCHCSISSLLIADRHRDSRRNNMSFICSAVIQYLQESDFVNVLGVNCNVRFGETGNRR